MRNIAAEVAGLFSGANCHEFGRKDRDPGSTGAGTIDRSSHFGGRTVAASWHCGRYITLGKSPNRESACKRTTILPTIRAETGGTCER